MRFISKAWEYILAGEGWQSQGWSWHFQTLVQVQIKVLELILVRFVWSCHHTFGLGAASRRQLMLLVGAGAAATLLCTALVLIFCFCRWPDDKLLGFGKYHSTSFPDCILQTTLFAFHICHFVSPKKGKRCHLGAINTTAPGSPAHRTRILSWKFSSKNPEVTKRLTKNLNLALGRRPRPAKNPVASSNPGYREPQQERLVK